MRAVLPPEVKAIEVSGAVAAEDAAMENPADQSAADDALRYFVEFAPQAFAAYEVKRIVG